MLANVWPDVVKYLLNRRNVRKVQFAIDADTSQKALTRYTSGENTVGAKNFGKIATGAGLTKGQLGYVYAWFLMQRYRPFRFDLGLEEESDVKEPAATYDPPTARERAEALIRLDTAQVPPELTAPLALMRKKIQQILDRHDAAIKEMESDLLDLVELFEQMFEGSMDVWKKMKSPSGD